jgi:purine-nucleoside phosphorylase
MLDKIKETKDFLQAKGISNPEFGIILGSGLGGFVNEIKTIVSIEYKDIPNFPVSTVVGHQGKLIYGTIGDKKVLAMQGRFHYYEGYTAQEITFPVRVMKALGIETLMASNACGGMNPSYKVGDLMILNDHINLLPEHPLRGKNEDSLGPRFPDMSDAYDKDLINKALEIGKVENIHLHQGVYVAVTGPTFETPAEYKFLRIIGADVVGMSTVPEVIVARHGGMKCFAVSVITDLGVEGQVEKVSHEEVVKAANEAGGRLSIIFRELIKQS